mmetsp:Transcript_20796/g.51017  ORF Transcript_20796/g.51017 Transcript_20796/m.51017 type:complete len:194 (-) Transcript_20796:42-623(-)
MNRIKIIYQINYSSSIINTSMEFLNSKNILFLNNVFDDNTLIYSLSSILYSIQMGKSNPTFLINCIDAKTNETLLLKESCETLNLSVTSIGLGQVKEAALLLMSSGANGKRLAFPNTLMFLSKNKFSVYDEYKDLKSYILVSSQNSIRLNRILNIEKFRFLISTKIYENQYNRGIFLSKKEAIELGIIDKLIK